MKLSYSLLFLSIFLFLALTSKAQSGIRITYDDRAGGLIERKVTVMPEAGARMGKFNTPIDTAKPFKVYPNPSNTYVRIEGALPEGVSQGEILVLNVSGQIVKTDVYSGQNKTIMVTDLKPGLYFLEIKYSKTKKNTYKIIVSN